MTFSPSILNEFLTTVAPNLNEIGKELLIKVAYWISLADGEFGKSEMRLLNFLIQPGNVQIPR